jgi:hypothetical protein
VKSLLSNNTLTKTEKMIIKYLSNRDETLNKLETYFANHIKDGSIVINSDETLEDILNKISNNDK